MKNLKTIILAVLATVSTATISAQSKKIDAAKSKIEWIGKKVTGQHNGTVNLKEGTLLFKSNKLTGGTFTVEMTSISVADLKPNEGKEKLEGHLNADDFFGTAKYKTSKMVFKKIVDKGNNVYTVTADLTIKDKTNPVTFDITVSGNMASAKFAVDRTKYDIKYGSGSFFDGLGDKTIYDNFDLAVTLIF